MFLVGCHPTPTEPEATAPITEPVQTQPVTQPEPTEPPEPPEPTEPEPTISPAEVLLERLSVEEKVGQLFLARCPDINGVEDVKTYHLGGYVLFDRDFADRSPEKVRQSIAGYQ